MVQVFHRSLHSMGTHTALTHLQLSVSSAFWESELAVWSLRVRTGSAVQVHETWMERQNSEERRRHGRRRCRIEKQVPSTRPRFDDDDATVSSCVASFRAAVAESRAWMLAATDPCMTSFAFSSLAFSASNSDVDNKPLSRRSARFRSNDGSAAMCMGKPAQVSD